MTAKFQAFNVRIVMQSEHHLFIKNLSIMQVNSLWLITFTLAEISRFKYGSQMSLTNPTIERAARKTFANQVGISAKSSAKVFLSQLKRVHAENNMADKFAATLQRFGLNVADF